MAVLVEAVSVVIKASVIASKYPGGSDAFIKDVPNRTLCADGELARVGFMTPDDVEGFIDDLQSKGLVHLIDGEAADLVVAEQQRGFTTPCSWAEFGRIALDDEKKQVVTACQLINAKSDRIVCPVDWKYAGSLSNTFIYVPTEHIDRSLVFLREEGDIEVYMNDLTGKEVFLGRTHKNKF